MAKRFNDVVDEANTGEKSAVRALQAWQVLIAAAHERRIVRYHDLREMMEYPDDRPLTSILACLMWYCEQHDLPPLTIIVVNQTGVPGGGFTAAQEADYHQRREDVFNYVWYRLVPPTVADLRAAFVKGYTQARDPLSD